MNQCFLTADEKSKAITSKNAVGIGKIAASKIWFSWVFCKQYLNMNLEFI